MQHLSPTAVAIAEAITGYSPPRKTFRQHVVSVTVIAGGGIHTFEGAVKADSAYEARFNVVGELELYGASEAFVARFPDRARRCRVIVCAGTRTADLWLHLIDAKTADDCVEAIREAFFDLTYPGTFRDTHTPLRQALEASCAHCDDPDPEDSDGGFRANEQPRDEEAA